jgi:hypothetical protein
LTTPAPLRDIAAHQRLQAGADGAEDGARAHHDAAHYAEIAHDLVTIQGEGGGHHVFGDEGGLGIAGGICHELILVETVCFREGAAVWRWDLRPAASLSSFWRIAHAAFASGSL